MNPIRTTSALALTVSLALFSCASSESQTASNPEATVSVEEWTPEKIMLPPDFAPHFGKGEENILFAPGMFTVGDEGFWSYAFTIDVEQALDTEEATKQFLEDYYDGLLRLVGKSRDRFVQDPATVELVETTKDRGPTGDRTQYEGKLSILDAFVTGDHLNLIADVSVRSIASGRAHMDVMVSPQQRDHPIWRSLAAAIAKLRIQNPES